MTHHNSGSKQNWRTPKALFEGIQEEDDIEFKVDLAADDNNHLCSIYFTEEDSALNKDWSLLWPATMWCNPPFKLAKKFYFQAAVDTASVYLLVPASIGSAWFTHALQNFRVDFFDKRIRFDPPDAETKVSSPPGGHALIITDQLPGKPRIRCSLTGKVLE